MRLWTLVRGPAAACLALFPVSVGHAENPVGFYKGKNVDLYIGYSVGGGYDLYARSLARHMGRLIAGNPAIVPKNMPGAGSLVLANWLYNVAPKDGTAFGTIGRGTAFDPLLGSTKAQFDASKFNWIGSMNDEVSVCVAWHTTGITRLEQVMQKELTVGGTGPAADTDQFPQGSQCHDRYQVQNRYRLSWWQRDRLGDGAGRSDGPLRLVMVERYRNSQELD